ncbi:MAG: bifunctional hydroxymethylpyrimidine kinase/phosphomethylpyrimidine kinase, partial [Proteobacteria bacterium]|nr:bifunctional hydroxymethylpyrimidine kinase/phosphomethylpyrimidine kinase [Pseudomonadota bacterium]
MLGTAANARAVARALRAGTACPVVLDPVLASSGGTPLLAPAGLQILREVLVPLTSLLTPNLPEAEILLGRRIADPTAAARDLLALGAQAVLIKGGHGRGRDVCDVLADARGVVEFRHPRRSFHARGTGCTLASAIAASWARGRQLRAAVADGEAYVQRALARTYRPGKGPARALPRV